MGTKADWTTYPFTVIRGAGGTAITIAADAGAQLVAADAPNLGPLSGVVMLAVSTAAQAAAFAGVALFAPEVSFYVNGELIPVAARPVPEPQGRVMR